MANVITREHAEKIVKKLQAVNESTKNSAHDTYVVYHNDVEIASFGIRRGSKKDKHTATSRTNYTSDPASAWIWPGARFLAEHGSIYCGNAG
jgi:hypothetical protein